MPSITIKLDDLHKIIAGLHEADVDARNRLRVLQRLSATGIQSPSHYAVLQRELKPQTEETRLPFYRPIMDALVAGDVPTVQSLLPAFADRVKPEG